MDSNFLLSIKKLIVVLYCVFSCLFSQDWEENASRALSLRKHLDLVTQLIIQWRRLELK